MTAEDDGEDETADVSEQALLKPIVTCPACPRRKQAGLGVRSYQSCFLYTHKK